MDNYTIADNFSLLAKLMEIHGENSFKIKSYSIAAFTIEKLPEQLKQLPREKIFSIKGIGDTIGKKIIDQLENGKFGLLEEYIEKTPGGVLQMLHIKGLGPKKIATIWKELEIESIGELLYACNENRLLLYKGFGSKTQQNVKDSIEFYLATQGRHLYAEVEAFAIDLNNRLQKHFFKCQFELTGAFKMQALIIDELEWVTTVEPELLQSFLFENKFRLIEIGENESQFKAEENIKLKFYHTSVYTFAHKLFITSCSTNFLRAWEEQFGDVSKEAAESEQAIFTMAQLSFIPAFFREEVQAIQKAKDKLLPAFINTEDIKGIIHSHSKWSDGADNIEDMAIAAQNLGLEYLVISDHSKSAFYANGLTEERIKAQHEEINHLNEKLSPFKIFKSIECDILYDGSLDYNDDVLGEFDIVIASIHSILKMPLEKAMERLLKAIANPYTSILGHVTGRLLLSRNGYPVDHYKIIDACSDHNVVIELNAHPRRLDVDWSYINYAIEKNVMISIDPDAHSVKGFNVIKYGILAAQKAGLTAEKNLSSFPLKEFEIFLEQQYGKRNKQVVI